MGFLAQLSGLRVRGIARYPRFQPSPAKAKRTSTLDWLRDMRPGTTMLITGHSCGRDSAKYCTVAKDVHRATRTFVPAIWSSRHFQGDSVGVVRWR
jgi:hypothetical protein